MKTTRTIRAAHSARAGVQFSAKSAYSFTLLNADGGISGFNPTEFAVDASGFGNGTQGGKFSVAQTGSGLLLNFAPAAAPPKTC